MEESQLKDTGERIIPGDPAFNYSFQHHLVAYEWARGFCSGKSVLDIGCGEGYGCNLLAQNASRVVGLDNSKEAVNHAQNHYRLPNLVFYHGDAYHLPFPDESFEVVLSFQVIEHLKRPERHLEEAVRVLTRGGILLLSTPNKVQFGVDFHLKIPFHYREFIPEEIQSLLKNYFKEVKMYGLWGSERIKVLHDLDGQAILRLVKLDPLGLRRLIPRKVYELVYPFMWKKSRVRSYKQHKDLIDSITTKDFYLKPLSGSPQDLSC